MSKINQTVLSFNDKSIINRLVNFCEELRKPFVARIPAAVVERTDGRLPSSVVVSMLSPRYHRKLIK